jgi:hypothetical protein
LAFLVSVALAGFLVKKPNFRDRADFLSEMVDCDRLLEQVAIPESATE